MGEKEVCFGGGKEAAFFGGGGVAVVQYLRVLCLDLDLDFFFLPRGFVIDIIE